MLISYWEISTPSPEGLPMHCEQFKAVQLLRPHDIVPHRQLAQLYAQMGQLRDAISEQNAALALDPNECGRLE